MLREELRALWQEPRPPVVPRRVRLDWALLAAGVLGALIEGAVRPDVRWRPVAVAFAVAMAVVPMWRRRRPLATVVAGFGAAIALTAATLTATPGDQVGLYSTGLTLLVLVYAPARWGSGRDIVLGGVVIAGFFALSAVADPAPVADQLVSVVILVLPAVLGASVRFRATARQRQAERVRAGERERLARELHDTVAHHVSAIVIRAQAGRVLAGTDPPAAVEALAGVEEEGARTLEEMRAIVTTLRDRESPAELAPPVGVADLDRLVGTPGGGPRVRLELDGDLDRLPPAVDAAAYRIVQESLTNARRHAVDATVVVVRITGDAEQIRVVVRDDGRPAARGTGGYGLVGLGERAALLGGRLRAGRGPERGWLVEAELPRRTAGRRREGTGHGADPRDSR